MRNPKRWSLRTRLLVGVLVLVAAGFAVAGTGSAYLMKRYLMQRVDEQLYVAASELSTRVDLGEMSPRAQGMLDEFTVEYRDPNGTVKNRFGKSKVDTDAAFADPHYGDPFYVDGVYHHAGYRVLITKDANGTLLLAYDMTETVRTIGRFVLTELLVMLATLVLAAFLGVAMVRMGLRPLTEVERTAEEIIAGGDLSQRVPELAGSKTEIGRLSRTLNTMLGEIDGSMGRMRRFVADASHELRTPLASIRGLAELHRQGAVTDPAEVSELLARIEAEAQRMGLLVEDLLLLARLDEERPLRSEPVDLVPIAADTVFGRQVGLDLFGEIDPVVIGDEDRLRQVVGNLVTNALTHTPSDTEIVVRVGVQDGQALLEVVDHGPGIEPVHAERIFERFYRADPARARDHVRYPVTGSGLGLSIVGALVAAQGGTFGHRPTPGGGATFWIRLPLTV